MERDSRADMQFGATPEESPFTTPLVLLTVHHRVARHMLSPQHRFGNICVLAAPHLQISPCVDEFSWALSWFRVCLRRCGLSILCSGNTYIRFSCEWLNPDYAFLLIVYIQYHQL